MADNLYDTLNAGEQRNVDEYGKKYSKLEPWQRPLMWMREGVLFCELCVAREYGARAWKTKGLAPLLAASGVDQIHCIVCDTIEVGAAETGNAEPHYAQVEFLSRAIEDAGEPAVGWSGMLHTESYARGRVQGMLWAIRHLCGDIVADEATERAKLAWAKQQGE